MWSFRKKPSQPTSVLELPRYKENPIYLFFEELILDVLGRVSAERSAEIQAMNLQKVFSTQANAWKDVIRETLHLSDTFEIAVLDMWIRNREHYEDSAAGFRAFAQDFADGYMADDSKVDVWPDGALEAAKTRIAAFQKND